MLTVRNNTKAATAVAIAFALATAVGFFFFPCISDDLRSTLSVKNTFLFNAPINWDAYFANLSSIFYGNHFRLPNLLMPLLILLPGWLLAVLGGFALYAVFGIGARLGGFRNNAMRMTLFVVGVIFFFPWVDQLYLVSFQVPYLWGTALSLVLIGKILKHQALSFSGCIGVFVLGLVVGFWQEAFAGAILGGCACLALLVPRYRTRRVAMASSGLVCGILAIAAPRLCGVAFPATDFFGTRMSMVYPFLIPTAVFAVVWVVSALRRRSELLHDVTTLFMLEVSIASALMTVFFEAGSRVDAFGVVCAIIGLIRVVPPLRPRLSARVGIAVIGLLAMAHLVAVDAMCLRLRRETDYVVEQYRADEDATIFAPLTLRNQVPWYLMQKPYYDWFAHSLTLDLFGQVYGSTGKRPIVVPEELVTFTASQMTPLGGDALVSQYGRFLIADDITSTWMVADYGHGPELTLFRCTPFTAPDGVERAWIYPEHTSWSLVLFNSPKSVSLPISDK